MSTAADKRVPVYKPQVEVRFHDAAGNTTVLHICGGSTFDPLAVARYVVWAYGTEPQPTAPELAELQCQPVPPRVELANQRCYNRAAARAYVNFQNFLDVEDTKGFSRSTMVKHLNEIGGLVEAWPDPAGGPPDLAYTAYDANGRVDPKYTTGRRPAAEVIAVLGGPAVEDVVSRI